MKLTEEQKDIALRLMMEMREEEDTGGSDEDFVLEIFSRFLAALPKPEPAAWVTTNEDGDYAMLFFDQQEARSYSGDDEPIGLAPVSSSAPRPDYKAQRDAERLDFLEREYIKVDSFEMPTGGGDADVGWRLSQYHMGKPRERVLAEYYKDDLRAAIDAAIASVKGGA